MVFCLEGCFQFLGFLVSLIFLVFFLCVCFGVEGWPHNATQNPYKDRGKPLCLTCMWYLCGALALSFHGTCLV